MNFSDAMTQYEVLKKLYDQKKLNAKDFENEVNDLVVTDGRGVEWKIGVRSGKWYYHDGQSWVEGNPQKKSHRSAAPEHIDTVSGPTPTPQQSGGRKKLSTIAIVGIAISAVALVAVIVVGVILGPKLLGGNKPYIPPTAANINPLKTATKQLQTATPTVTPTPEGPTLDEMAAKLTVSNVQYLEPIAGTWIMTGELTNENDFGVEDISMSASITSMADQVIYEGYVTVSLPDLPSGGNTPITAYLGELTSPPVELVPTIDYAVDQPNWEEHYVELQWSQLSTEAIPLSDGYRVSFIGLVVNASEEPAMVKNLGALAISAEGTIVGGVPSFNDPWNLGYLDPGKAAPFVIDLYLTTQEFEEVDQILAMATGEIVDPIEGSWEMVSPDHGYLDSNGYFNLTGIFKNTMQDAHPGVVIGWLLDADGNLIDVGYFYSPLTVIQPEDGFVWNIYNWSRAYQVESIENKISAYSYEPRILPFEGGDLYEVVEIRPENLANEVQGTDVMHFTGDVPDGLSDCNQVIAVAMVFVQADGTVLGYGDQYFSLDSTTLDMYLTFDPTVQDPTNASDFTLLCEKYLGE